MRLHEIAAKRNELRRELHEVEGMFNSAFKEKIHDALSRIRKDIENTLQTSFASIETGDINTLRETRDVFEKFFGVFDKSLESEYVPKPTIKLEDDDDDDDELEDDDVEPPFEDDL